MTDGYYVDPADYPSATPSPEPAPLETVSPRMRAWRTTIQALTAFLASLPVALTALPAGQIPETTMAWMLAIPAALIVVISATWNAIDAHRGRP